MTCRHSNNDPDCTHGGLTTRANQDATELRELRAKARIKTPDAENYEVVQVSQVGKHLVMKVLYPNCSKCSYEGNKVMVFLDTTTEQAILWKKIDPHFRADGKTRVSREAPGPAARFPASKDGWEDAMDYARRKERA